MISYLYKLDNKYRELGQVDLDRCNSKWDTSEVDKSRHRAVRNILQYNNITKTANVERGEPVMAIVHNKKAKGNSLLIQKIDQSFTLCLINDAFQKTQKLLKVAYFLTLAEIISIILSI